MNQSTKTSFKDWLIITRIRISNFIKEHKYISLVIGIFLFSAIVALVVRAATDETISNAHVVREGSNAPNAVATTEYGSNNNTLAPTFSTVTYTVSYYLSEGNKCNDTSDDKIYNADEVTIKATLNANDISAEKLKNIKWGRSDETTSSSVSEDGRTITIKAPLVSLCSVQKQTFTLNIYNADKDISIKPTVSIKGGTSDGDEYQLSTNAVQSVTTTYDESKEYTLKPYVSNGIAAKVNSTQRNAIFGVMLGVESSDNLTSLKGSHLSTSADVYLLAQQTENGTTNYLNLNTENGYFGTYKKDLHYFTESSVPDFGINSGSVTLGKADYSSGANISTTTSPTVTLVGPINEDYDVNGISFMTQDSASLTNSSSSNYSTELYKDGNRVSNGKIDSVGEYEVKYNYSSNIIVIKKINVTESTSSDYALIGPKVTYVQKGSTYIEQGLYKKQTSAKAPDSDYVVSFSDSKTASDISSSTREYTETYKDTSGNTIATRTIKVVNTLPTTTLPVITVTDSVIIAGSSYTDSGIKVDGVDKTCSSSGNPKCTYEVSSDRKKVNYTVSSTNYEINISKNLIETPQYYKLAVSNIIPSATDIKKISNNFYAIGSYFVTATSVRDASSTNNITISLKAIVGNSESTGTVVNKQYSDGADTSKATSTMYVKENSDYVVVDASSKSGLSGNYYTAAMGEEVKMISTFEYGYDADEDISKLTVTIPVNGNLIPISYSTEISDDTFFDLTAKLYGEALTGTPKRSIVYYDSSNHAIDPLTFDSESQTISSVVITIEESDNFKIKPGTTIDIGTKYKVKTFNATSTEASNLSNVKFSGSATFSWHANEQDLSKTGDVGYDVYITPYKARAAVGIGLNDNYNQSETVVLDASKNDIYTLFAAPDVISPAMNVTSNIFGYNRIANLPVVITLPKGIDYAYNKEYKLEPKVSYSNGTTTLVYNYSSVEPNSWIEPIYVDFNIDVSIAEHHPQITIAVGDVNGNDNTINNDVSSISKYKKITKTIDVQNAEVVSYGQYVYQNGNPISNINKDDNFDFSTKLHSNEAVSDVNIYTVLPYLDTEKESSYSGKIELEGLPSTAMCTSEDPSRITSSELVSNVQWQACSDFKNSNSRLSNVTAYKVSVASLAAQSDLETSVRLYTTGNKPDDTYTFKSYLTYKKSNGASSGYINFRDISVDVVSKKITGVVWEDFNVDGIMDASENKLQNVTLMLYDSADNLIDTTTPNDNGVYTFAGLAEGKYYVVADFNTDQYGITGNPSEDFYDKTRLSVFKAVAIEGSSQISSDESTQTKTQTETEDEQQEDEEEPQSIIKTDEITIGSETRIVRNINLGLSLKKKFEVQINKYINKIDVTNALGIVTTKNYENTKLAKLDVKNINNLSIKVIYTLELQNVKYYPGYVGIVTESIPDGMSFNPDYDENKGWQQGEDGTLTNTTLSDQLINAGEKKYLTVAFDITRKEAGSFVNYAYIDELKILGGEEDE